MSTLIVSAKPNGGYDGRFTEKASNLVKSGIRVGMMHVSGEGDVHCHVCNKDFAAPERDAVYHDAWGECTHCKLPFVFVYV